MFDPHDAIERLREALPDRSLAHKHAATPRRQPVISPPPLPGLLHPTAFDQAFRFESIERWVERGDMKHDRAVGSLVDLLADVVAVPLAFIEQREDEQFRTAALQLPLQHRGAHILAGTISRPRRRLESGTYGDDTSITV